MEEGEDPGPSSIVARADALMQRRRQLTGLPRPDEDLPVLTEAVDPDDDLPVLGEDQIVPPEEEAVPAEEQSAPGPDPALVEELAQEITRRVHERLTAEIPALVDAALRTALEQLTRDLQQAVAATSEEVMQDFLDEHPAFNRPQP